MYAKAKQAPNHAWRSCSSGSHAQHLGACSRHVLACPAQTNAFMPAQDSRKPIVDCYCLSSRSMDSSDLSTPRRYERSSMYVCRHAGPGAFEPRPEDLRSKWRAWRPPQRRGRVVAWRRRFRCTKEQIEPREADPDPHDPTFNPSPPHTDDWLAKRASCTCTLCAAVHGSVCCD